MAKKVTPHYTLVAPSADGTCCPCSALSDPCTCAGLVPIIRCRTRSALATLCGFHAFTDPEDPPVAYREKLISGTMRDTDYGPTRCSGSVVFWSEQTLSGSCTYNESCASLSTLTCAWSSNTSGSGAESLACSYDIPAPYSACLQSVSVSRTIKDLTGSGTCCVVPWWDGTTYMTSVGGLRIELTKPDTEQQALYRATNGLKWSDWAVLTVLPGCSALWELRSGITDYDFSVRESEYQLEFPALTVTEQATDPITGEPLWQSPGVPLNTTRQLTAQVEVRVDINRRPWNGGSPWMLYRTDTFGPMTITGTQTLEGVVPNDRGYETIITNVRYRVVG